MIKSALFTSIWDDGVEVTSSCMVNVNTKEVFDIEPVNVDELDLEILKKEFVTIKGVEYPVSCGGEGDTEYWYS